MPWDCTTSNPRLDHLLVDVRQFGELFGVQLNSRIRDHLFPLPVSILDISVSAVDTYLAGGLAKLRDSWRSKPIRQSAGRWASGLSFRIDELRNAADGLEVLRHQLRVVDLDAELVF